MMATPLDQSRQRSIVDQPARRTYHVNRFGIRRQPRHFGNFVVPIEFHAILYPTDFSDLSLAALDHARRLADMFDARFHCLHVVDDAYQHWSALGPESVGVAPPPETMLELAHKRLTEFREEHLTGLKREPTLHVVMGTPFSQIIAYARNHEVGLIVMATHGRSAVAHMLLGSTTEKVVRKSPCAVLTVRSGGQEFVMP